MGEHLRLRITQNRNAFMVFCYSFASIAFASVYVAHVLTHISMLKASALSEFKFSRYRAQDIRYRDVSDHLAPRLAAGKVQQPEAAEPKPASVQAGLN